MQNSGAFSRVLESTCPDLVIYNKKIISKMTFRLVLQLDPFNLTTLSLIKLPDKDVLSRP